MGMIRSFRDLVVYKRAVREEKEVFLLTRAFPREEMYSLTDQVRRSSRAVGSMLAAAWAKRRYPAAFISKVNDALGEAMETQGWFDHALARGYITAAEHRTRDAAWQSVGAMLNKMIDRADTFCKTASST